VTSAPAGHSKKYSAVWKARLRAHGRGKTRVGGEEIENRLEVHDHAGDVPALQGETERPEPRFELMQENWSPAARLLMGALGGAMALRGMRGRGLMSAAGTAIGLGILSRSVTNLEMKRLTGMGAGRRAVEIHKAIHVDAPLEEVFAFWSNYENFPRFMSHLREVRLTGDGRSHWVAEGPGGVPVTWDAETTGFAENEVIAWKSTGGAPVRNAGIACFQANPDGGTRIDIRFAYNPPAGALFGLVLVWVYRPVWTAVEGKLGEWPFGVYVGLGLLAIGGGAVLQTHAGLAGILTLALVDRRGWLAPSDLKDALAFTQPLPGSTVVQVVAFLGWRLRGRAGGAPAGRAPHGGTDRMAHPRAVRRGRGAGLRHARPGADPGRLRRLRGGRRARGARRRGRTARDHVGRADPPGHRDPPGPPSRLCGRSPSGAAGSLSRPAPPRRCRCRRGNCCGGPGLTVWLRSTPAGRYAPPTILVRIGSVHYDPDRRSHGSKTPS
jgi:uncharacterized membrane protein